MDDDTELTSEEKMAFAELPREAQPSELLQERIVRTLRREGVLRSPGSSAAPGRGVSRTWFVAAASVAASLVLFGSGLLVGHWAGTRSAERILVAARQQDDALVAQRVQEAGSAYVRAIEALARLRAASGTGGVTAVPPARLAVEIRQGGESAMGALYAAALELARLAPDDPDVERILRILEDRQFAPAGRSGSNRTTLY